MSPMTSRSTLRSFLVLSLTLVSLKASSWKSRRFPLPWTIVRASDRPWIRRSLSGHPPHSSSCHLVAHLLDCQGERIDVSPNIQQNLLCAEDLPGVCLARACPGRQVPLSRHSDCRQEKPPVQLQCRRRSLPMPFSWSLYFILSSSWWSFVRGIYYILCYGHLDDPFVLENREFAKRSIAMNRFLNRIASHPILAKSSQLRNFLELEEAVRSLLHYIYNIYI